MNNLNDSTPNPKMENIDSYQEEALVSMTTTEEIPFKHNCNAYIESKKISSPKCNQSKKKIFDLIFLNLSATPFPNFYFVNKSQPPSIRFCIFLKFLLF